MPGGGGVGSGGGDGDGDGGGRVGMGVINIGVLVVMLSSRVRRKVCWRSCDANHWRVLHTGGGQS